MLPCIFREIKHSTAALVPNGLILYGESNPITNRCRMGLKAKKLSYTFAKINRAELPHWFHQPPFNSKLVPFLSISDNKCIRGSYVILEYLNDAYPLKGVSFHPIDSYLLAQSRMTIRMVDGCAKSILKLEASKKIDMKTEKLLLHLEGNLKERGYLYSTDEFTVSDIYALPLIEHILSLCNSKHLEIDMKATYPKLYEWIQVLKGNVLLQLPKDEPYSK